MAAVNEVTIDGVVRERWDDNTRLYTEFAADGSVVLERPYDASENENADQLATDIEESANEADIGNKIETVDMPAMQGILDQTNANLRADPSQELKDIAKAVRRLDRKVQKILDGTE